MSSSPVEYSIAPQVDPDPYTKRIPPYSEDAEQAVLSAILMDPEALLRAQEHIDDTMFYYERNRRIYRAMVALNNRADVIDPLTLTEELIRSGELEASGGRDYISYIVDAVPTSAGVEYHAKIVREKALRRRLIEVSTAIVTEAFDSAAPVGEILDAAEHKMFEVNASRGSEGFSRLKELTWRTMERIEELHRRGESITGVPSGFKDLDDITAGFQDSDLVVIAGRPSMGKTAFVLNVAQNAAIDSHVPIAFFSLEMSKEQLVQRLLTSEGRVDAQHLRKAKLHPDEFVRLGRAAGTLSQAPIWIDDTPGMGLLEMRSKARRLKLDNDIRLVIVDYLQLMQGPTNIESRQQEISQISRSLKSLARELRVPVVALSQLSRAPELRTGENKRPQLSDLRESGAIEQDADLVIALYRPEAYAERSPDGTLPLDKDGRSIEGKAEVIVLKQRNGPTGSVTLYFDKTYTRFENYLDRAHPV